MKGRFKASRRLILAIMTAALTVPAAAQTNSKAGQITLIAIMPETLSLSFNNSDAIHFAASNMPENTAIATTVSTAWSLTPGRAKVVTSACFKQPAVPVLVALATPQQAGPGVGGSLAGDSHYGFRVPLPAVAAIEIDNMNIMENKRRGTNTATLPGSNSPAAKSSSDISPGTLTIQVQPVL